MVRGAAPAARPGRAWPRWPSTLRALGLVEAAGGRIREPTARRDGRGMTGRGMSALDVRDRTARSGRSSVAIDPATILADLEAGRRPGGRTRPDGPRRLASPARGQDRDPGLLRRPDDRRLDGRAADVPGPGRRSRPATTWPAGRGGSCRVARPSGAAPTSATGVVVMPPSYVNVGAWVGPDTMVDSHVLVGSCAQIGARVHLGAGVTIGGVLEPPGARPVIVEDDAFVGCRQRAARGRARRARRGHRRRGDADRDVARLRPRPRDRSCRGPPTRPWPCRRARS